MIKNVSKLLKRNFKVLIKFELKYKLLYLFIISPLFSLLFKLIMKTNGFKYLTFENIFDFIKMPSTIIMVFILLVFMMIYTVFEIITIIVIIDASRQNIKLELKDAVNISIKKSLMTLRYVNIGLIFLVLFLIPFLNIGIASSFISVIKIPEYIMDFIKSNIFYFVLYLFVMLVLIYTLFRWIYVLNYIVIDNCSFHKAKKNSIKLGQKSYIKDFLKILLTEGLIYISYVIFVALGILLIVLIHHYIQDIFIVNSILITIIWLFLAFSLIIFTLASIPISYAAISYLFYKHKYDNEEEIKMIDFSKIDKEVKRDKKKNKLNIIIMLIILITGTIFTYGIQKNRFNLNINMIKDVEITAHRGLDKYYPENTMISFKAAKKAGADWIELDVQSTKDNYIIVMHDSNFKRVSKLNKNVWDVNYSEIKNLDVGSFFDKKYKGETIPLLEDVVKWAKENDVKLNIELKPTGHEVNFEKNVLEIINKYGYENNCVITSGKYESLKNIKKLNKKIKTIYVMSLAYGDITKLKYADGFSVEASNISKSFVKKIHKENKEIYAWTINSEINISKMLSYNVDNIITDDITNTKNIVESNNTSNVITEYIKMIQKIF